MEWISYTRVPTGVCCSFGLFVVSIIGMYGVTPVFLCIYFPEILLYDKLISLILTIAAI